MFITKRGAGRPSREDTAGLEDHILDCARRAFCRQGFAGTSMDDIADECRVTKHTVYRRYPSKAALLGAVIDRDLWRLRPPAGEECCFTPMESMRRAAKRCFEFSIEPENATFFAFLQAEALYSEDVRVRFQGWHNEAIAPLVAAVIRAQRSRDLPVGNPMCLAERLLDLIDGPCRRLQLGRGDIFHGESADAFFETRWSLFLGSLDGTRGDHVGFSPNCGPRMRRN